MLDIIAGRQVVFHSHKQNNSRRQTLKRVRPIAMPTGTYSNTWSNTVHPGKALPRRIARKRKIGGRKPPRPAAKHHQLEEDPTDA